VCRVKRGSPAVTGDLPISFALSTHQQYLCN
jgi:hypothetical protein